MTHHQSITPVFLLFVFLTTMFAPRIACATNVKDFGAKGDGQTDDTEAIREAIRNATDGLLEFPRGSYRITQPLEIDLSQTSTLGISGRGGSAKIVMAGAGPALRITGSHDKGSALPASISAVTWEKERMPLIDALEIVGAHPEADGIALVNTLMPVLRGLLIREVRHGIHLTSRNRNVIIDACHIYNARGTGIYLDEVNIHQMIVSDSHISYCKEGGIKVRGGEIRNFQITGNDIEYNCDPEGKVSADIWVDCSQGGSVREGTISGNTIQAIYSPGGANIRLTGTAGTPDKIGLWSISGNHIGNQDINIHLDHCRGVTITANTFMRGYDRHLKIDDSKNVLVNDNVFDHNEEYYTNVNAAGGISVHGGEHILLNDNIIEGAGYGNTEEGGAIVITGSQAVTVSGTHIHNARYKGIQLRNSTQVQVSECLIDADPGVSEMTAGIWLDGDCPYTVIRNNSVGEGKNGHIINHATGAALEGNRDIP